jgi:hypothetical protein
MGAEMPFIVSCAKQHFTFPFGRFGSQPIPPVLAPVTAPWGVVGIEPAQATVSCWARRDSEDEMMQSMEPLMSHHGIAPIRGAWEIGVGGGQASFKVKLCGNPNPNNNENES